jgi:RNA polymerase sigma factor (sigma-70 family)
MQQDNELVKLVKEGDRDAFRNLVIKYQTLIVAICFKIVRNKSEAENIAQETFIQIFKSIHTYDNKNFKLWIGKIATNKSIDWKRKYKNENILNVVEFNENLVVNQNIKDDMINKLIQKEDIERVKEILNKIPEKYSKIIKKYYFYNKSYKEISVEENISIKTVESRLYRGKKNIKKIWEKV